jgi:S-disulfanyl-L-cysteine oxidoreductase SoxD
MALGPKRLGGALVALAWIAGATSLALVFGQADGGSAIPVSTGVYDDEQADVGREAFARHCASCHGADLSGGFGPRLVPLDPFVYRDQPLSRPFEFIRTQMPFDAPGSLEDEVYAAILAHVLRENGYPSGADPLPADPEALAAFVLDDPPVE